MSTNFCADRATDSNPARPKYTSRTSIGKLTIFVVDRAEYAAARKTIGERYRRRMGAHYPAMTLVEVRALLDPGARVEIDGIAWI